MEKTITNEFFINNYHILKLDGDKPIGYKSFKIDNKTFPSVIVSDIRDCIAIIGGESLIGKKVIFS